MSQVSISPEKIIQFSTGAWACSILGAAVTHSIFNLLEGDGTAPSAVAEKVGLSIRGTQALLDGLVGLGLVNYRDDKYHNSDEASTFLVSGKPSYLGGFCKFNMSQMGYWAELGKAAKTGSPVVPETADVPENTFWNELVPSIAALSFPLAQMAAEHLKLKDAGAISWLDVGGGSGIYSAVWLGLNPEAKATQIDWPNVNRIGRDFVSKFGVGNRFHTIDCDFHKVDFGINLYDIGIYSHIAHQETSQDNITIFRKLRKAIKPGGTLLISDFVLSNGRTGHPFAMMFNANMLLLTKGGATYREADYEDWLRNAGFKKISIQPTQSPATLIYAS